MAGLFNWRMMQNKMKRPACTGNSAEVVTEYHHAPDICSIALGTVISIVFNLLYCIIQRITRGIT